MVQNSANIHSEQNGISLKEFILKLKRWWKFIWNKWLTILIIGFIGGVVGLANAIFTKTKYIAVLSFAVEGERSNSGLMGATSLASQFGFDLGGGAGGAFSGDNLLELIKSRSVIESTLLSPVNIQGKTTTLVDHFISFNKLREKWRNSSQLKNVKFLPNTDRSEFSLTQDSLLGGFYKQIIGSLTVNKIDKKLSIITVKFTSENELFSKIFTEMLVKNVSDFYINTKIKKSVKNIEILQHQYDSIKRVLNYAITNVASSADANPNPNPTLQILRAPSQHRQVDVESNKIILSQIVPNLEISKIALRKETPLVQIIDRPILPLEKDKLGKFRTTILMSVIFGIAAVVYLTLSLAYKELMNEN